MITELHQTASLTTSDSFTTWQLFHPGKIDFTIIDGLSTVFGGTVHLQRQFLDAGVASTTYDFPTPYTAATTQEVEIAASQYLRAGIKSGNYTSGTIVLGLRQDYVGSLGIS